MLELPAATQRGPRPVPVAFSLAVHLTVLATVALGPSTPRQTAYQREIAPHEKKLVWYRFNQKLPDVAPAKTERPQPEGASVKHTQAIASRSPSKDPAKQMTLGPAPELKMQPDLAAPNLMAFEPPKLPPKPRQFTPPQIARAVEQPRLESAPELAVTDARNPLAQIPSPRVPKPAPKAFTPPVQIARRIETPQLEPGQMRIEPALPNSPLLTQIPAVPKPTPKVFTPPQPQVRRAAASPTLEAAPAIGSTAPGSTLLAGVQPQAPPKPQPRRFTPPPAGSPQRAGAPALDTAPSLTAAVVGLNPAERAPVIPDATRRAEFSAAPDVSRTPGVPAPPDAARITAPDLTIRSGAAPRRDSIATIARVSPPTSSDNVRAAMRPLINAPPVAPPPATSSARVVSAGPDPRFEGRLVYTVAIQMPNVTSYSGSWILWYAERQRQPGEPRDVAPPSPLRKVDPIYDLTAAEDRVEGKVQLSAIIHTDGFVYGINVLSGLDPRLDKNAIAALRKWEFEPARRDGSPVDVDIVIEIPFRLRPLKK